MYRADSRNTVTRTEFYFTREQVFTFIYASCLGRSFVITTYTVYSLPHPVERNNFKKLKLLHRPR
jgi:hypothetical protein